MKRSHSQTFFKDEEDGADITYSEDVFKTAKDGYFVKEKSYLGGINQYQGGPFIQLKPKRDGYEKLIFFQIFNCMNRHDLLPAANIYHPQHDGGVIVEEACRLSLPKFAVGMIAREMSKMVVDAKVENATQDITKATRNASDTILRLKNYVDLASSSDNGIEIIEVVRNLSDTVHTGQRNYDRWPKHSKLGQISRSKAHDIRTGLFELYDKLCLLHKNVEIAVEGFLGSEIIYLSKEN
jgi:hypothetical protein